MNAKGQSVLSWWPAISSAGAARPLGPNPGALPGESVRVLWTNPAASNGHRPQEVLSRRASRGGRGVQLLYALVDICVVFANGVIAFLLRFSQGHPFQFFKGKLGFAFGQPYISYEGFLFLYTGLILLFCDWQDLYRTPRTRSAFEESVAVVKATFLSTLFLTAFIYLSGYKFVSRLIVAECLLLNAASLMAWRYAKRKIVIHRALNGTGLRNVVIIGAGEVGKELARQLEENKLLGYQFKGFLD